MMCPLRAREEGEGLLVTYCGDMSSSQWNQSAGRPQCRVSVSAITGKPFRPKIQKTGRLRDLKVDELLYRRYLLFLLPNRSPLFILFLSLLLRRLSVSSVFFLFCCCCICYYCYCYCCCFCDY